MAHSLFENVLQHVCTQEMHWSTIEHGQSPSRNRSKSVEIGGHGYPRGLSRMFTTWVLDRMCVCVVLRHGETVEASTLPECGNNPILWLTQNETGNKGEQPITLQFVLKNNAEREKVATRLWTGVERCAVHRVTLEGMPKNSKEFRIVLRWRGSKINENL